MGYYGDARNLMECLLKPCLYCNSTVCQTCTLVIHVILCFYVCMYVCMYSMYYVCMYVCTYVCMYICMYICVYVCILATLADTYVTNPLYCIRWLCSTGIVQGLGVGLVGPSLSSPNHTSPCKFSLINVIILNA